MFDRKNNGKTRDPGKYDTKIFDHKRSFSSLLFSFYSSPNIVKKWFLQELVQLLHYQAVRTCRKRDFGT